MSNFFIKERKKISFPWLILGFFAVAVIFFALVMIWKEAHICQDVESVLHDYFKKPTTQEYAFSFEQKYGKDYICVYDQENATLVCKYPIYKRLDQK